MPVLPTQSRLSGKDAVVLSYGAMRKAVGVLAISLPVAVVFAELFVSHPHINSSISAYYYEPHARDFFVGILCAVGMFQLSCRGYDKGDQITGVLSGILATGVAFFPCGSDCNKLYPTSGDPQWVSYIHYGSAALLFVTLAAFCLFLFTRTQAGGDESRGHMVKAVHVFLLAERSRIGLSERDRRWLLATSIIAIPIPAALLLATIFKSVAAYWIGLALIGIVGFTVGDREEEAGMSTRKRMRNRVYRGCGGTIVAAILGCANAKFQVVPAVVNLRGADCALLLFEAIALFAFGVAWLVKGEAIAFLNDRPLA